MRIPASFMATRALVAVLIGALAFLAGAPAYASGAVAGLALVALLAARRSGRYVGTAAGAVLRRDERGRMMADRAARNGFVVVVLALGAIDIVSHALGRAAIPLGLVEGALAAGALAWLASDLWQRRG